MLDDKKIRLALKIKLFKMPKKPIDIIDELGVCNGNAIADLVAVYADLHCFEIKSDLDSLYRLNRQSHYYDRCFKRTTIVLTKKSKLSALDEIPTHWGVIEAYEKNNTVRFRFVRKARDSTKLIDVRYIFNSLWKEELYNIYVGFHGKKPLSKYNKDDLIEELLPMRKNLALFYFRNMLSTRNQRKSLTINVI